ncbi:vWA-like protein [Ceratobasidium sp. AG-I]|nr:vWA-like protein [Ceratobasidium sp. AG-I]
MVATTPTAEDHEAPPPAYDQPAESDDLTLTLALVAQPSSQEVLISLTPPSQPKPAGEKLGGKRAPLDLCLVIDVSGSMDSEAPVPGEQDKNETTGLSVLDVVKHATRTIIESMGDDDRVAIITFSDSSEIVAPLTAMTKENRASVWSMVDRLRTKGMTNLWDGLKTGMNVIMAVEPNATTASPVPSAPPSPSASKRSSFFSFVRRQSSSSSAVIGEPQPDYRREITSSPVAKTQPTIGFERTGNRLSAVFILTDGQPNVEPPRGHIPMLKSYIDGIPPDAPKFTISTFGFGYNLNSRLLDEIADLGNGTYGFIPDSGMVGTVFVHAVANVMSTWATDCILDVEVTSDKSKAKVEVEVLGALPVVKSSWGATIRVGDIQYGQSRDVVLKLPADCFGPNPKQRVNITARYSPYTLTDGVSTSRVKETLGPAHEKTDRAQSVQLHHEIYRLSFVSAVSKLFTEKNKKKNARGREFKASLDNYIYNPLLEEHEPSIALTSDITSQVVLGLEPEHWDRWGAHYAPSLARSHQRQQCSNFKDAGLQVYGRNSTIFTSIRDHIDKTFDSLPPPTPSLKDQQVYRPGSSVAASYAPVHSMAMYRSSAAPCFAGWCHVDVGHEQTAKVCELRRGMTVRTPTGNARVAAVLRTACSNRTMLLSSIGQLAVTPWHPIMQNESWVFPAEVCEPKSMTCDYVYSILLEPSPNAESHALCIEGTWCVTLGHGCTDSVRAHEFLGNYTRVMDALSKMEGYYDESGIIDGAGVVRHAVTQEVCDFKHAPEGASRLQDHRVNFQEVQCEA